MERLYAERVIKSFRHKGLETFFITGKKTGVQPDHAKKLQRQLAVLDNARTIQDQPQSWKPHPLSGVTVSGNWRLTFVFEGTDVHLLDYLDYH